MTYFIELTTEDGYRTIVNVAMIKRVFEVHGQVHIVGVSSNGYITVKENYEYVIEQLSKVNRLQN